MFSHFRIFKQILFKLGSSVLHNWDCSYAGGRSGCREIVALLNRINDLLVEFTATSSAKRQAAVKAELEAATDKLKRVALSFQN